MIKSCPRVLLLLLAILCCANLSFAADEQLLRVQVTEPYMEMYTGPGRGFPIFYSVERGEWIEILKRRTDWFEVRTRGGKTGWVKRSALVKGQSMGGSQLVFDGAGKGDLLGRPLEFALLGGALEDDPLLGARLGYYLTDSISVELVLSHVPGEFSRSLIYGANVQIHPWGERTISPYFSLGSGIIENEPKATLIGARDVDATVWSAAIGARYRITDKFNFRVEARNHQALVNEANTQNLLELTAGFSFFY